MDGQRFDEFAKRLAGSASRREVVRAIAGGMSGGLLAIVRLRRPARVAAGSCSSDADCPNTNPSCVNGRCRSAICPADSDFCQPQVVGCGPRCGCATDINGNPFCTDAVGCVACTSDADCEAHPYFGAGSACVVATGPMCNCPGGKGCARACPGTLPDRCAEVECGECASCDPATGACIFNCTLGGGDGCCDPGETCNVETGACEAPEVTCADDADCVAVVGATEETSAICCGGVCRVQECCPGDPNDDRCAPGETCNQGTCQSVEGECVSDTDCNPCFTCVEGICEPLCGACEACDETSGDHGTCHFDCRVGEGNACCNIANGQICDQETGTCVFDRGQFGSLVIKKVDDKGNPLTGACFDLLRLETGEPITTQPFCDGGFGDSDRQSNGMVTLQNNVRGIFRVRESVVPPGYNGADDQITPNIGVGETVTITFVYTPRAAENGKKEDGEKTEGKTPPITLPSTGAGRSKSSGVSWLTGAGLIGAAAALLGGRRLREGASGEGDT